MEVYVIIKHTVLDRVWGDEITTVEKVCRTKASVEGFMTGKPDSLSDATAGVYYTWQAQYLFE